MSKRRFPPPWIIDEMNDACFIVRDKNGQALGYFYFEKWLGLSDAIAEGPVLSFKSVLRFRDMSVSYLKCGVYDARNPRADAFLNCFLLPPRTWVFQFAGFLVMPQDVALFLI